MTSAVSPAEAGTARASASLSLSVTLCDRSIRFLPFYEICSCPPNSSRKSHPAVQGGGPLFTTGAWLHAHSIGHALDHASQSDLLFHQKARKADVVHWFLAPIGVLSVFLQSHHSSASPFLP